MTIKDKGRFEQKIDFDGFNFGNLAPTDIDAFMEFKGKLFLFFEVKSNDNELTQGQKIGLENVCKAIQCGDKHAFAILVRHKTPVPDYINFSDCVIDSYFYNGQWKKKAEEYSCFAFTQSLYNYFILT